MVIISLLTALVVTSTSTMEHQNMVTDDHVSTRALDLLPDTLGVGAWFEQVVGPVVVLVEESAGFSDVDPEKIAIYGDSWMWTRWSIDRFDVSDPLFDGAAQFHAPFPTIGTLRLRFDENPRTTLRQGVGIDTIRRAGSTATVLARVGEVGGKFPFAVPLMAAFSGKHSTKRTPPPTERRRRFGPSFELAVTHDVDTQSGTWLFGAQAEQSQRRYLAFRWDGVLEHVSPEDITAVSVLGRYHPDHGRYEGLLLAEVVARDRMFAEVGFQPKETSALNKVALFGGLSFGDAFIGLSLARYGVFANDRGFTRDVIDPDGMSLFPYEPDGTTIATKIHAGYEHKSFYLSLEERQLFWSPDRDLWTQPVTFRGEDYGRWQFRSRDTITLTGDHRIGLRDTVQSGPVEFGYDVFSSHVYATDRAVVNPLSFLDVGFRASAALKNLGAVTPSITLAKTPMPLTTALARGLDPAYHSGAFTLRDGRTIDNFGAVRLDDHLTGPTVYRAALGLDWRVSPHFRFGAQGIFKLYRGLLRLKYDGRPEQYGRFVDGIFYTNTTPKGHVLTNADEDLAVYFAMQLDLTTTGYEDLFFSASFSAYNAIGTTPFGNGATANDLAVVSPSSANPNAQRLGQAALDLDRAFVLKIAIAYQIVDRLWLSTTIRHRDGQPFSFLDPHVDDGQVALTYHSNRGSPFQYQRPLAGPREDFQLGADVQIAYSFDLFEAGDAKVWLLAANLFDMENEIAEVNGPPGVDGRAALESQLPRSLLFGVTIEAGQTDQPGGSRR